MAPCPPPARCQCRPFPEDAHNLSNLNNTMTISIFALWLRLELGLELVNWRQSLYLYLIVSNLLLVKQSASCFFLSKWNKDLLKRCNEFNIFLNGGLLGLHVEGNYFQFCHDYSCKCWSVRCVVGTLTADDQGRQGAWCPSSRDWDIGLMSEICAKNSTFN